MTQEQLKRLNSTAFKKYCYLVHQDNRRIENIREEELGDFIYEYELEFSEFTSNHPKT